MASQLNGYRNFIDIRKKEGQALVSNAVDKFISPLVGDEHVQLLGKDFQKLKDNLLRLGSRYGYGDLIERCAIVRTVIPEIVDDPNAIPPVIGVPEEIHYTNSINILEHYSDENIVLACKHALLTFVPGLYQTKERSSFWSECTPSSWVIKSWNCLHLQPIKR